MADERVEIEIVLDDGSVQKGFAKVESGAKRTGRSINTTFKQSFRLLTKEVLAFSGVFIGLFAGREIIAAAARQEQAVQNLNTALRNAGSFSQEASRGLQDFATQIQETTRFGDELILQQTALARNFVDTNEEARELVRAAVDLSEATGISLDSAVRNLGKTFSGLTGELGESLPALRNLTQEQLKAGEAVKLVSDLFGGTAARNVQTFSGRIEQLQNNFGDALEGLGQFVTKLPLLSGLLGAVSEGFAKAARALKAFTEDPEALNNLNNSLINFGQNVITFVIVPIEAGVQSLFAVFKVLQNGLQTILGAVVGVAEGITRALAFVSGGTVTEGAENLFASIREQSAITAQETNEALASIGQFEEGSLSVRLSEGLEGFRTTAEGIKDTLSGLDQPLDDITKKAKETAFQFIVTGKEIAGAISAGVQGAVKSAKSGGSFLEGFFGSFLAFIGNWAIQTGTTLIAVGLGIDALKASIVGLTGGPAIAAGIALVALGTLLSSLSGGGGAEAAGGGVTPGTESGPTEVATDAEEAETRETKVAINVEGTVLDPAGVANQIAEILNDNFDAGGTAVRTVTA